MQNVKFPEVALRDQLSDLYGPGQAEDISAKLLEIVDSYRNQIPPPLHNTNEKAKRHINEKDVVLITYADIVYDNNLPPLQVLGDVASKYVHDIVSIIHLLPIYPYSSDDGFAIIDYDSVDPSLGTWEDVRDIGLNFRLMLDAVINHVSAESAWFKGYLSGEDEFSNFFISVNEQDNYDGVFRPRDLPLFTTFQSSSGPRVIWTTFSDDQVDLNYANPNVLLSVVETLLFYASNGAQFIRLDAIAYLWKEEGTSSVNLPQTHRIIQLIRSVLDIAAPHVSLITETNVPHEQNISYFGDGQNEAQFVYNFSLPPLVLNAFHSGEVGKLSEWASVLETPSEDTFFFNFLASHDGIGLMPARGILSEEEIELMVDRVERLGGFASYRSKPDGSRSPYELNINYLDALADPSEPTEELGLIVRRFLTSQAIMLSLIGVPGIYFHSLFGSRSWPEGVKELGSSRSINRQKLSADIFFAELAKSDSLRSLVYGGYRELLRARRNWPAFHPSADQEILKIHPALFTCRRTLKDGNEVFCGLHNVTNKVVSIRKNISVFTGEDAGEIFNLVEGQKINISDGDVSIDLLPYGSLWLGWVSSD